MRARVPGAGKKVSVILKLGTRGSALALAQARWVADLLGDGTEIVELTTSGDRDRGVLAGDIQRGHGFVCA